MPFEADRHRRYRLPDPKPNSTNTSSRQAEIAIEEADSLIMVVDAHIGPTELDKEIAKILLPHKKARLPWPSTKSTTISQEHLMYRISKFRHQRNGRRFGCTRMAHCRTARSRF